MLLAIAAAGLLFAQAEAQVATPAAQTVAAASAAKPDKPKQICKTETQTGSNFSKRICHTAEEWKAMNDAARDQSDAFRACKNGMGC